MTHSIADTSMRENGGSAMDAAQSGARRTVGMAQENPLGLAAAAAAVGFVAGSLLPSTRVEEERIGPVASQTRQQVSELASEAVEHGKQVAQDTVQAAAETASESGQQHAQELKRSAEESASQATPTSGSQSTVG